MSKVIESPFHQGEQKIQQRLGVRDKMERFGRQVIRDFMPDQHRDFYAQLSFVFVAHADKHGWPWASMLFNHTGFISSPDKKQLNINAVPVQGDPLVQSLTTGNRLGLLGIDLETRRRNRLSGSISKVTTDAIELNINQAFGNCPQYIQSRELHNIDPKFMPPIAIKELSSFDQQAIKLISQSDTFFVASYVTNGSNKASEGADVSHRGGKPGFIRVDDAQSLTIPDYLGNFHFNTLGNFLENAKAGLLFIDFVHGHMLTLTGTTEILWDSPDMEFFSGAERLWKFRIDHGYWLKNVLPLRWQLQEYSPNTTLTGSWLEVEATKKAEKLKHTWQPYQLIKIVEESSVIKSFYLQAPADQKPHFQPGQFLTLKTQIDGQEIIRTYTVSSAPGDSHFRISIKHERSDDSKPEGVFSSYMHLQAAVGDIIQAKAPTGTFTYNSAEKRPALLIAAGVGITPMISMVRHALQEGIRTRAMRTVTIICSARDDAQRAFFDELNEIATYSEGRIRVVWALTQPESHLQIGSDFHHHGRISKQLLQSILSDQEFDTYLCGPNSFMQSQYNWLRELGISNAHIFTEAFGPASLERDEETISNTLMQLPAAKEAIITFTESRLEQAWSQNDGSLLEFAEAHGLNPSYGCRSGQCGACKARLLSGKVTYKQAISTPLNEDEILLCSAIPAAEDGKDTSQLEIEL
ncbi:MAG: pyridoxamine 5'-phosphate oxidase family protein [Methylococcales bacterium]|nr:pyridoxamine 5'-phosphate oxidase family protein [Methylococcales bacterium]